MLAASTAGARDPDECQPGAAAPDYGDRPPEPGLHYGTRPVVLGCGQLASCRRIRLVGYQLGRRRTALCIDRIDVATGQRSGCGSNRVFGGGALDATSTSTAATGPALAGGATSAPVRSVAMSYELDGRLRQARALVIRISDPALLRAIRVLDRNRCGSAERRSAPRTLVVRAG